MKLTVVTRETKEAKYLHANMAVRYDDEDIPYDFPLRQGDIWEGTIDLDTHRILEWPAGKTGEMQMKGCDEGVYKLLDADGKVLVVKRGYVPNSILPGEYGDYVHLIIAEDGTITNWPKEPSLYDFQKED